MKLHTRLTADDIYFALANAKHKGRITQDVQFDPIEAAGSRSHLRAYEIQLGTATGSGLPEHYTNQYGKRQKCRRTRNSRNANLRFSATWHEWGWFMAEVFNTDPYAMWGSKKWGYDGRADFNVKTSNQFTE